MPKLQTFPTLYNEALQINISKLKELINLQTEQYYSGELIWYSIRFNCTKRVRGSISIIVNTKNEQPYIELNYSYRDKPRNYKVQLVSIPSNLGKGHIWYFLCPQTYKRCRKLYSINGYFLHREAFNGCMYESQTKSKKWREMEKVYGCYFDSDRCYQELHQKHFKKYYNGKPTKRYLKLMETIERSERIPMEEINRLLVNWL